MPTDFDVIIAGGGLSGLFCAKELASKDLTVKVFEEHNKIGHPNKCSGVVSLGSLKKLGLFPLKRGLQNRFSKIMFHSPSDNSLTLNFNSLDILVLNRYELDNFLSEEAVKSGATISISSRIEQVIEDKSSVEVKLRANETFSGEYLIDARGVTSYKNKKGLYNGIQSYAFYKNFEWDHIHVFFDKRFAPGFFAWLIPIDEYNAKIGLASRGQPLECLRLFQNKIGVKNLFNIDMSPIIVGGPIEQFVEGRIIYVGDSAGQTKPTTGGGIYFGGAASLLASEAINIKKKDPSISLKERYEKKWFSKFKREVEYMKMARKYYEKMENDDIEKLFSIAKSSYSSQINLEMDYDFHMSSLVKALGIKSFLSIAANIFGSTVKDTLIDFIHQ